MHEEDKMPSNVKNIGKGTFKSQITRKQNQFKRFKRRYMIAISPVEMRFLKNEAKQICIELKQFAKQWKTFGFGGIIWITKNFTMTQFISGSHKGTIKNKTGRRYAKRSYARKSHGRRITAHRTMRGRKTRRYSVAW
jgi:exosome complex RNA-binding protein Rrp4